MAPRSKQKDKGASPVTAKVRAAQREAVKESKAKISRADSLAEARQERVERRRQEREAKHKENADNHRLGQAALSDAAVKVLTSGGKADRKAEPYTFSPVQLAEFEIQVAIGTPVDDLANQPISDSNESFPSQWRLWQAIGNEGSELAKAYARGKATAVARLEEAIVQTAATPLVGKIVTYGQRVTKDGDVVDIEETREADMLGHRQFLVDTLKWQLAHIRPKKHGRNVTPTSDAPNEQLKALIQALNDGPAE